MENPTPFDLNEACRRWRAQLGASPAFRAEDLDELESHLRDSVATLESKGLSAEEAFLVAQRRLGTGDALDQEFGKVNREQLWLHRALWMVAGSVVIGTAGSLVSVVARCAMFLGLGFALRGHALGAVTVAINLVGLLGLLLWLWRGATRSGGRILRLGGWMRAHPLSSALLLAFALLASHILVGGANFLVVKWMGPGAAGTAMLWVALAGGLMPVVLWPSVLAWLLVRVARGRVQVSR